MLCIARLVCICFNLNRYSCDGLLNCFQLFDTVRLLYAARFLHLLLLLLLLLRLFDCRWLFRPGGQLECGGLWRQLRLLNRCWRWC